MTDKTTRDMDYRDGFRAGISVAIEKIHTFLYSGDPDEVSNLLTAIRKHPEPEHRP